MGFILTMGGENGSGRFDKKVEIFYYEMGMWNDFPNLKEGRSRASSCRHGDFIYVFCGFLWEGEACSTIERMSLRAMQDGWELIRPTQRLTIRF